MDQKYIACISRGKNHLYCIGTYKDFKNAEATVQKNMLHSPDCTGYIATVSHKLTLNVPITTTTAQIVQPKKLSGKSPKRLTHV